MENNTAYQLGLTPQAALDILCSLKHRAEKTNGRGRYSSSYVQVINLNHFLNVNTQVIYGRNGTGKTHVFQTFREWCTRNYEETRVIPVYFDMRTLEMSRIAPDMTHEEIIIKFYEEFLNRVFEDVVAFYDTRIDDSFLKRIGASFPKLQRSKVQKSIKNVRKLFGIDNIRETVGSYVRTIKRSSGTEGSAGISGSSEIKSDNASASAQAKINLSSINKNDVEIIIKGVHAISFEKIRDEMDNLARLIGAKSITILIDEWSQLDVKIQPLMAEMMRRTICVSDSLSLKVAAIKYSTVFSQPYNDKQYIGFQAGVDITELTDLNFIYTYDLDKEVVRRFLLYILVKHFLEELGERIFGDDFDKSVIVSQIGLVMNIIFEQVFESYDAFDYFIRASEGNPRDFLAMIGECCATNGGARLPISSNAITISAINHFANVKAAHFNHDQHKSFALFDRIFRKCLKINSKIFFVSKNVYEQSKSLQELWNYRIIHLIDNKYSFLDEADYSVHDYVVFSIDYGKMLSVRTGENGKSLIENIIKNTDSLISRICNGDTHENLLKAVENSDEYADQIRKVIAADVSDQMIEPGIVLGADAGITSEVIQSLCIDDIVVSHVESL